jgi:hypothetical protein
MQHIKFNLQVLRKDTSVLNKFVILYTTLYFLNARDSIIIPYTE